MIRLIRILLTLLVIHFGTVHLTACTSSQQEEGDELADDSGDIDDEGSDEVADESDDTEESSDTAENTSDEGEEDDLESELDQPEDKKEEKSAQSQDDLDDDIGEENLEDKPVTPPPTIVESEPEDVPPPTVVEEKARVRDIRFLANSSGGTVVIETSKPVTYQTRMNSATGQFVIEMANVDLPAALQRSHEPRGSGFRIGSINAYQGAGSTTARVVVQMASGSSEPIVQQEGTSLVVIPPAPVPVATTPAPAIKPLESEPSKPTALAAKTLDEFLTGNQKFYGRVISLQIKDADVRDVINFLAEESGANIVMSDDVDGKISLKLRRIPWDQALVTVMRTKSLGYVRQGNVLRISTLKALQAETEAASRILEAQKAIVPAVVQVMPISYADLDDLSKNVAPFLSKDGKVQPDKRTSTLIVTDKAEVIERIQRLVKTLDVAPAQVSIESKIVEAIEEFNSFIGVNWGFNGAQTTLSEAGGAQGAPINLSLGQNIFTTAAETVAGSPMRANLNIGTLDFFGDLTATLALAERDSLAKVISAPRISSMNREKSTIRQEGENVTITRTVDQSGTSTVSEKRTPFSLELAVTPQITADGGVIMDINVRREFLGPIVSEETKAQAINKRSAQTKILVRNGQTAVIGGIYTSDELEANSGVPGLKNVPILGWLFKSKNTSRSKNELLIFMTPRILAENFGSEVSTISAQ